MKKRTILTLTAMVSIAVTVKAQTINMDTLAKYSRKEEQLKVFNRIAADIHLSGKQTEQFNQVSIVYANRAIATLGKKDAGRHDIMKALRAIAESYRDKLKTFLSQKQWNLLKDERSRYHFGRRFLAKS